MPSLPFVSVVVTSYNYEKFLPETLNSLINQTYRDFEVIIVDDGSSDGSVDIIKEYTSKYSNFYFYTHPNNENRGLVESMLLGISKSKGEYVAFLESDDYWDENHLRVKVDYIKNKKNVDILCNRIETIGSSIRDSVVKNYHSVFEREAGNMFWHFYSSNILPTFSTVMIKKSILESLNFDTPIKPWLDFWLWRQCAFSAYNFCYTSDALTYWRIHFSSYISKKSGSLEPDDMSKFLKASDKLLKKKNFLLYLFYKFQKLPQKIFSIRNDYYGKILTVFGFKKKYRPYSSSKDKLKYLDYILESNYQESPEFVPLQQSEEINNSFAKTKLIAFYSTKFCSSTLWEKVCSAIPHFVGHYQPHCPIDVSCYDLSGDDVMYRQVELAKQFGLYGFCFDYYWFSDRKLFEQPLLNYLNNKKLNFPFCLCWMGENSDKLWDIRVKEVLSKQQIDDSDAEKFVSDILPFLKDDRYIKIDGKPVMVVYSAHLFDKEKYIKFTDRVKILLREHGFDGLYMIMGQTFGIKDNPSNWNMDAMVEIPPHNVDFIGMKLRRFVNPNFDGFVFDMPKYLKNKNYLYDIDYTLFKTVMPSYDNSCMKAYSNAAVYQITPEEYMRWLDDVISWSEEHHNEDKRFVFINSWNAWDAGAHLEPDKHYGYAYLQATKDVVVKK